MAKDTHRPKFFSKESYLLEDGSLHLRRLLVRTVLLSIPLLLFYFLAMKIMALMGLGHSELAEKYISTVGVPAVALYVYFMDLLILPLSVDLIWPFVMSWPPLQAILVIGTSSVAGAFTAYLLGRLIGLIPPIKAWVLKTSGTQAERLIIKYGVWALVISALTPLPFSTLCILAGVVRLKAHQVFLGTTVRYIRMAIYYCIFTGLIYIS